MVLTPPVTVHPELVEGCVATPFMLRQAQHERLSLQGPCYYILILELSPGTTSLERATF